MMKDGYVRQSSVDSVFRPNWKTLFVIKIIENLWTDERSDSLCSGFLFLLPLHFIHYLFSLLPKSRNGKLPGCGCSSAENVRKRKKWKSILILGGWKVDVGMATKPNALNAKWFHFISIVSSFLIHLDFLCRNSILSHGKCFVRFLHVFLGANHIHMCYCATIWAQITYEQQSKLIAVISLGR